MVHRNLVVPANAGPSPRLSLRMCDLCTRRPWLWSASRDDESGMTDHFRKACDMTTLSPSGFLTVGASHLEYRMIGPSPENAPAIVMLHEGLGSAGLWGDFPEKLQAATGAGVFVYSRAGYGASTPVKLPRPLDYMHVEALDVLPKLLDQDRLSPRPAARPFRRRLDRGDLCRLPSGSPRRGARADRAAFHRRGYFGGLDCARSGTPTRPRT